MISDNERREVVRRLREIRLCKSGHIMWWEIAKALGLKQPDGWFGWEKFEPDSVNRLADFIEPDDPPYNLYTLYEAVFRRSPRCRKCIEDDEVDELVDALLDICNAPGHEHIQRSEPAYPDATASYKGWRVEVYDPEGVLASPSNVAADLVRSHADPTEPSEPKVKCVAEVKVDGERLEQLVHDAAVELTGIDREALLALVVDMDLYARTAPYPSFGRRVATYARRIREAIGATS